MALLTGALPWPSRPGLDDDGALVARMADGDEAAVTALYERHASAVLAYLRQLTGDPEEAEELLQDTFVAAWRAAPSFAGRSGPGGRLRGPDERGQGTGALDAGPLSPALTR